MTELEPAPRSSHGPGAGSAASPGAGPRSGARSGPGAGGRRPGPGAGPNSASRLPPLPTPADLLAARAPTNRRRALALAGVPGAAVFVVAGLAAWALSGPVVAAVLAVVLGAAASALAWAGAPVAALAGLDARPVGPEQAPRAHNLLEALCTATGLPCPRLLLVDHDCPNALVVASDLRRARLVVTSGLLDALDRMELEAVLAHELCHLKSGDVLPATLAVTTVAPVAALIPSLGGLLERVVGIAREERADLGAVSLTRYPPGLVAALARIQEGGGEPPGQGLRAKLAAHLWLRRPGVGLASRAEILGDL